VDLPYCVAADALPAYATALARIFPYSFVKLLAGCIRIWSLFLEFNCFSGLPLFLFFLDLRLLPKIVCVGVGLDVYTFLGALVAAFSALLIITWSAAGAS